MDFDIRKIPVQTVLPEGISLHRQETSISFRPAAGFPFRQGLLAHGLCHEAWFTSSVASLQDGYQVEFPQHATHHGKRRG